jgi:hypothetical protein
LEFSILLFLFMSAYLTVLFFFLISAVLPWLSPNAYGLFSPAGGLSKSITPSAIKNTHTNFSLPLEGSSRNRVAAPAGVVFAAVALTAARQNVRQQEESWTICTATLC